MAFFSQSLASNPHTASFSPLFRLLDDFDQYSRGCDNYTPHTNLRQSLKSFSPKFDLTETNNAFELKGELPGIDKSNVELEFAGAQTLTVKGHHDRKTVSTSKDGIEWSSSKAITEGSQDKSTQRSLKAHVDDEDNNGKRSGEQSVVKSSKTPDKHGTKYWVSERVFGEFSRTFNFPVKINQEATKASLQDGILTIVVPKSTEVETRRIAIS